MAAVATADFGEAGDEPDPSQPVDLFETKLDLVALQEARMVPPILLKVGRKTAGSSVLSVTMHTRLLLVKTVY